MNTRTSTPLRTLCSLALVLSAAACTTIRVSDQRGQVLVQRHFGLVSIELSPSTSAVVAETSGFGYLSAPLGATLGLVHSRIAALPEACHLVIWADSATSAERWQSVLGQAAGLCVVNAGKQEE
jgi:hypothetical protein